MWQLTIQIDSEASCHSWLNQVQIHHMYSERVWRAPPRTKQPTLTGSSRHLKKKGGNAGSERRFVSLESWCRGAVHSWHGDQRAHLVVIRSENRLSYCMLIRSSWSPVTTPSTLDGALGGPGERAAGFRPREGSAFDGPRRVVLCEGWVMNEYRGWRWRMIGLSDGACPWVQR